MFSSSPGAFTFRKEHRNNNIIKNIIIDIIIDYCNGDYNKHIKYVVSIFSIFNKMPPTLFVFVALDWIAFKQMLIKINMEMVME